MTSLLKEVHRSRRGVSDKLLLNDEIGELRSFLAGGSSVHVVPARAPAPAPRGLASQKAAAEGGVEWREQRAQSRNMETQPPQSPGTSSVRPQGSQERSALSRNRGLSAGMSAKEEKVAKFVGLLGCKSSAKGLSDPTATTRSKELNGFVSSVVEDGDVVLDLPSAHLSLSDGEAGQNNPLPRVGDHFETNSSPQGADIATTGSSRPLMTASVLSSTSNGPGDLEQKNAAACLEKPTAWTKSTFTYAPSTLASNISQSFTALINSRVRAWTLWLLKQSLASEGGAARSRLLSILSARFEVSSTETKFTSLPMPSVPDMERSESDDVILPLLFEASLDIVIKERTVKVALRAPGNVCAQFSEDGLRKVIVRVGGEALLKEMVESARTVVVGEVARVSNTPAPSNPVPSEKEPEKIEKTPQIMAPPAPKPRTLIGIRSSLNIAAPGTQNSPSMTKARSSALKLSSVLSGKGQSTAAGLGMRKTLSVRWNTPGDAPKLTPDPVSKRQRLAQSAAKLKSFRSFGRPHGGDFGSGPRNATFGDYGGRGSLWGRDGRLAHHPMAMQSSGGDAMMGMVDTPDRNATFELPRSTSKLLNAGVAGRTLPRTATTLEMQLLKSSGTNVV